MAFENMRVAAERLRWTLDPADASGKDVFSLVTITGSEGGIPVRIERRPAEYRLSTIASIEPALGVEFAITHEGLGGTLANVLGFHDIQAGDREFDKSFHLVSQDPAALVRLLTPQVKDALRALSTHARRGHINPLGLREFYVSHGTVVINRIVSNLATTADDIIHDIAPVVAVVRALNRAASSSAPS